MTTESDSSLRAAKPLLTLAERLRCPHCCAPLSDVERLTLGCENGHRFDANKRGYVSLLPPRTRVVGDTPEMLAARAAFFAGGWYAPIAAAVADAAAASDTVGSIGSRHAFTILDAGCGTGYYLQAAASAVPRAFPIASDLSAAAVVEALRALPAAGGLVADVWAPLPLLNRSVQLVLSVFAPRNLPEFARVLEHGGSFIAVVPTAEHLAELQAAALALEVPAGKADELAVAVSEWFTERSRERVAVTMQLDAAAVDTLIGMGPSAHHRDALASASDTPGTESSIRIVTASVDVLRFERR